MAAYAELDASGVWQNTVSWDGVSAYAPPPGWTLELVSLLPPGGSQGWTLNGSTWTAPVVQVVVPASVTRAQFYLAAAGAGIITTAQAVLMLENGTIPANLATAIAGLPTSQQGPAEIAIFGMTDYSRSDPFVQTLGALMGMTPAQLDALFIAAGSITL